LDRLAYLSHLNLTNFRSLVELDLELPSGVVVFFGPNAQGKTTLLEAVYLLAIARSFRAENERELVTFPAAAEGGQALVGGTIEKRGERLQIYVGYQCLPGSGAADSQGQGAGRRGLSVRKQIRVNRVRHTGSGLVGLVTAVLFSADDIRLVQGPPADRRRFLDILISQADPPYLKGLQRYQRVVQQRNQLLRMLREGRAQAGELAFWDEELVREGTWITWRRWEVMEALAPSCDEHHRQLSGPEEDLRVEYRPSIPVGDGLPATEDRFRESLAAAGQRERATASTAVGPHRDDFYLRINEVNMGAFASRGQARTLALTLRLAEAAYLASVRGEGPIILLDDVLSELDAQRGKRVLEKATQYEQTLITTTEPEHIRGFFGPAATYFSVTSGGVNPCR
jgi:DNA replication and repair protein RecF